MHNSSTLLPNEVGPQSRSVDLQDILMRLSQSSDFHFLKSEDVPANYTPNLPSIYHQDHPEKEFLLPKQKSLENEPVRQISYIAMIKPYRFDLSVCLLSYAGLLLYSLIKGGKGFDRYG